MKTAAAAILLVLTLSLAVAQQPIPVDVVFPKVGETYRIETAAPLVEPPHEGRVTVLAVGQGQWVQVQFAKMERGADGVVTRQMHEMWVNFAHVTSAVKTDGPKPGPSI